ncbi:MAG TPA: DUF58 domain-containing protein, partial [Thermoleophilia bacterium]|nr:DUF58 domain-containing protein [Thermoleophilia bacterium]
MNITRSGWIYIVLTLLVGAAAVNATNNLLYLIASGLLALMSVSGIVAYLALRRLQLEVALPREWFAGQEMPLRMTVVNDRRYLSTFLLSIANAGDRVLLAEIPARGQAEGVLHFALPRRGRHGLGELTVTSAFPFAFFKRGGVLPLHGEVVVYPAPSLPSRDHFLSPSGHEAGTGSQRKGVGGDFWGMREYAPGDPPTRVNWRAWARHGTMVVNEFHEDSTPPLMLTLESVPGPTIEERLSQLTGMILEAGASGRPVGLSLPGTTIQPGVGLS